MNCRGKRPILRSTIMSTEPEAVPQPSRKCDCQQPIWDVSRGAVTSIIGWLVFLIICSAGMLFLQQSAPEIPACYFFSIPAEQIIKKTSQPIMEVTAPRLTSQMGCWQSHFLDGWGTASGSVDMIVLLRIGRFPRQFINSLLGISYRKKAKIGHFCPDGRTFLSERW
jgi:hypothetical protein